MSKHILQLNDVSFSYRLSNGVAVEALNGVTLAVEQGERLGIVGESGCGKSTLARCMMGMLKPNRGSVCNEGINVHQPQNGSSKSLLLQRQMIFQNALASLDPHLSVEDIITEPLRISGKVPPRGSMSSEAAYWLEKVGLDALYLQRHPQHLSGGQAQRVAIARALAAQPRLLLADEPIAALDVSMQAQIVNLLRNLQQEQGFTLLFIAHDLAMVRHLCDRIAVMYRGRIVELAPTEQLFADPQHGYTKALLSAIPLPDPRRERLRQPQYYTDELAADAVLRQVTPGHFVLAEERSGKHE